MLTSDANAAPAARGIHRRATWARGRTQAQAFVDRRYAWVASLFVFVLSVGVLPVVSAWAVGVALALMAVTVIVSINTAGVVPLALLAITAGQWGAAGGLLPAALIWALWLPALAHNQLAAGAWTLALSAPVLWATYPDQPVLAAGVVMGLGVGWYFLGLLNTLRQRANEYQFDTNEANAVIVQLQNELKPYLDAGASSTSSGLNTQFCMRTISCWQSIRTGPSFMPTRPR